MNIFKNKEELTSQIKDMIAGQLGISSSTVIELSSDIEENLGADSLDVVELVMFFEDEFDIEIQDNEWTKLKTVGLIVDFMATKLNITN